MRYVNAVDEDFFHQKHVQAQIMGKNAMADFQRAVEGTEGHSRPPKKHFKNKKTK
jgi:hypothetical protein